MSKKKEKLATIWFKLRWLFLSCVSNILCVIWFKDTSVSVSLQSWHKESIVEMIIIYYISSIFFFACCGVCKNRTVWLESRLHSMKIEADVSWFCFLYCIKHVSVRVKVLNLSLKETITICWSIFFPCFICSWILAVLYIFLHIVFVHLQLLLHFAASLSDSAISRQ